MRRVGLILLFLLAAAGCAQPKGQATVVWVSIDGFRHDYLERFAPPTLTRLAHEGAYTTQEIPIFPSLTFPNHAAQVTGRSVDGNGIPSNAFLDTADNRIYRLPDSGRVLRAEPIWFTAKRAGLRVAAISWPMSHLQLGPLKSDYYLDSYDGQLTDRERLLFTARILRDDHVNKPPLRLVLTYMSHVDSIGHRNGPDSPEVREAVLETDEAINEFIDHVETWFDATHGKNDELYLLFTTDHGMATVKTRVNMDLLLGAELLKGSTPSLGGPMAMLYLTEVPAAERAERASKIVEKLKEQPFIQAWLAKDVLESFHFSDPTRIGEVVALLPPGYVWTEQRLAAIQPVPAGSTPGAHGYDPAATPDMLGAAIVWRYRHPMNGINLGPVSNTQWHASVAHWLGISAAPESDGRVIPLP